HPFQPTHKLRNRHISIMMHLLADIVVHAVCHRSHDARFIPGLGKHTVDKESCRSFAIRARNAYNLKVTPRKTAQGVEYHRFTKVAVGFYSLKKLLRDESLNNTAYTHSAQYTLKASSLFG